MPNEAIKASLVWDYVMSVQEVEEKTGYQFFNKLSKRKQKIKAELDAEWWKK